MASTVEMPDFATCMAVYAGLSVAVGIFLRVEPKLGIGLRDAISAPHPRGPALSPRLIRRLKTLETENRQLSNMVAACQALAAAMRKGDDNVSVADVANYDADADAARTIIGSLRLRMIALETENKQLRRGSAGRPVAQVPGNIPSDVTELQALASEVHDGLVQIRSSPSARLNATLIHNIKMNEAQLTNVQLELNRLRAQQMDDDSRQAHLEELRQKEREAEERIAGLEKEQTKTAEKLARSYADAKSRVSEMEEREAEVRARVVAMEEKVATRREAEKAVAERLCSDNTKLRKITKKIHEGGRQQRGQPPLEAGSAGSAAASGSLPKMHEVEAQMQKWKDEEAELIQRIEDFTDTQASLRASIDKLLQDGHEHATELQRVEALQEPAQRKLNSLRAAALDARNEVKGLQENIRRLQAQRAEHEADVESSRLRVAELRDHSDKLRQEATKSTSAAPAEASEESGGSSEGGAVAPSIMVAAMHNAEMDRRNAVVRVLNAAEVRIQSLSGIRRQEAQIEALQHVVAKVRALDQLMSRRPSQALEIETVTSRLQTQNRDLHQQLKTALENAEDARMGEKQARQDLEDFRRNMNMFAADAAESGSGAPVTTLVGKLKSLSERNDELHDECRMLRGAVAERERELARAQGQLDAKLLPGLMEEEMRLRFEERTIMCNVLEASLPIKDEEITSLQEDLARFRTDLDVAQDLKLHESSEPGAVEVADERNSLRTYCGDLRHRLGRANRMIQERSRHITALEQLIASLRSNNKLSGQHQHNHYHQASSKPDESHARSEQSSDDGSDTAKGSPRGGSEGGSSVPGSAAILGGARRPSSALEVISPATADPLCSIPGSARRQSSSVEGSTAESEGRLSSKVGSSDSGSEARGSTSSGSSGLESASRSRRGRSSRRESEQSTEERRGRSGRRESGQPASEARESEQSTGESEEESTGASANSEASGGEASGGEASDAEASDVEVSDVEDSDTEDSDAEESNAEESNAEVSNAEESNAEASNAEDSNAEDFNAEDSDAEASIDEDSIAEDSNAEASDEETPKASDEETPKDSDAERSSVEPSSAEPSSAEPSSAEPSSAEPSSAASSKNEGSTTSD